MDPIRKFKMKAQITARIYIIQNHSSLPYIWLPPAFPGFRLAEFVSKLALLFHSYPWGLAKSVISA
jgi:hypothetical protein